VDLIHLLADELQEWPRVDTVLNFWFKK